VRREGEGGRGGGREGEKERRGKEGGEGEKRGKYRGEQGGFLVLACGVLRRHFCMASNADFSARSAGANARAL